MSSDSSRTTHQPENAEQASADRRSAHIGLVCTHIGELRPLMKRIDRVRKYTDQGCTFRGGFLHETIRIAVAEAGRGFARHRLATEILIREHHPAWVFSLGFSSALVESIQSGDLSLASEIIDTHGNATSVKCSIPASRRIHVGRHVVADSHPLTSAQKLSLAESSQAIAADTSSKAVAMVCEEQSTRFLSIRAIVDELGIDIPETSAALFFEPGSKAIGTALGSMVKGFRQMSELNHWRKKSATAAEYLDRFAAGIILQIGEQLSGT